MRFEFKSSFDRSVKSFHGREKEEIKKVALQAIDILSHDVHMDADWAEYMLTWANILTHRASLT